MAAGNDEMNEIPREEMLNVPSTKAYKSADFLMSACARPIRIICELNEPEQRLSKHKIDNFFLFVGSHLLMRPEDRAIQIADIQKKLKDGGARGEMESLQARKTFMNRMAKHDKFYVEAESLAGKLATWNNARVAKGMASYNVLTGGGPGIMEAANRGARNAGAVTLGFGSSRPEWVNMNKYVSEEGAFEFHYFFMRKYWMAYKCMALIVSPGGYGTMDELFEFLQLISSKRIKHRLPIILMGKEHWQKVVNWEYMVESCIISQSDLDLIFFADTADEAFQHLTSQMLEADTGNESTMLLEGVKKRRKMGRKDTGDGTPLSPLNSPLLAPAAVSPRLAASLVAALT